MPNENVKEELIPLCVTLANILDESGNKAVRFGLKLRGTDIYAVKGELRKKLRQFFETNARVVRHPILIDRIEREREG